MLENTFVNKLKFMASYFWQRVGCNKWTYSMIVSSSNMGGIDHLHLRPLSAITDEDAIEVAKLQDWKNYEDPISMDDRNGIRDQLMVQVKNSWLNFTTVDFLRSRGYLLPFMGLSVEKIIEYGWVKID